MTLDLLDSRDEFIDSDAGFSTGVRLESLATRVATIDRCLAPARRENELWGFAATTAGACCGPQSLLVRPVITLKSFKRIFEGDAVAHRDSAIKGESARTLNLTDMLCVKHKDLRFNAPKSFKSSHPGYAE